MQNTHQVSFKSSKIPFLALLTIVCLFSLGEGSKIFFVQKPFLCEFAQSGSKMTNLMVITHFGNLCLIFSQSSKTHFYSFSPIIWIQVKYRGRKNPGNKAHCILCYQNTSISWRFRPFRTKINHHFIGWNSSPLTPTGPVLLRKYSS